MRYLLIILSVISTLPTAHAQPADTLRADTTRADTLRTNATPTDTTHRRGLTGWIDKRLAKNEQAQKREGLFIIPVLYFFPDTRLGFGALAITYFKVKNKQGQANTRLSWAKLLADYTLNRQLDVWGSWNIFLRDEDFLLRGELRYRQFPDRFYGIGNRTPTSAMERYQYNLVSIKLMGLRKLAPGVFLGADYQLLSAYNFSYREGATLLPGGTVTGSQGGRNSGLGLVFLVDTRDNVVSASSGTFLEASTYFYRPALGSTFNFTSYGLVFNRYWRVPGTRGHVFGTNTVANFNDGDPPFLSMATAGGDEILRGYARNRYRDRHFLGTQVEYRLPLWWRFGLVGFAGLGDVFARPSDVTWQTLKYSYGGGLRFAINRREKLNIRLDYGFGRGDNQGFYLSAVETF